MHIHHLIRGGLFLTGVGIGTICLTASAGADSMAQASLPVAPAATPIVIEVPAGAPGDEVSTTPDQASERPVIHAGPGPAVPVPGATTLIDPLVIERPAADDEV